VTTCRDLSAAVGSSERWILLAADLSPEVTSVAVRWYLRYGLSYRDVEELLAERGVMVDHVTVYGCVQRFTPEFNVKVKVSQRMRVARSLARRR
jgi:transposase-like protein